MAHGSLTQEQRPTQPSAPAARLYQYEARGDDGQLVRGSIDADDRDRAALLLSQRGLFVIRLSDQPRPLASATARPKAKLHEVAWQMWQLSVMIESGISLRNALSCLSRQSSQPRLRALFEDVSRSVEDGRPLSEAMLRHPGSFPASLIAMVRASELTGKLSEVLLRASTFLMKDVQVMKKMRSTVVYPVFMLAICLAVTTFLVLFVLPRFASIFAAHGAELPLPTRVLLALSRSLVEDAHLWLGGGVAIVTSAVVWGRSAAGRRQLDYLAVSLPGVSPVMNMFYQTRSFRTLSILLETRASLVDSVRIVRSGVANSYYRELWQAVEEQVLVGEQLAAPLFASAFIEESVAQMVDNGDRTGQLGKAFGRLADFMEERYEHTIKAAMQLLEPVMILAMGFIIGFVALAMMLPLFRAAGVVSQ